MSRAGPGSQDDSACRDEFQREVTPDVTNRNNPNEKSVELNRTPIVTPSISQLKPLLFYCF